MNRRPPGGNPRGPQNNTTLMMLGSRNEAEIIIKSSLPNGTPVQFIGGDAHLQTQNLDIKDAAGQPLTINSAHQGVRAKHKFAGYPPALTHLRAVAGGVSTQAVEIPPEAGPATTPQAQSFSVWPTADRLESEDMIFKLKVTSTKPSAKFAFELTKPGLHVEVRAMSETPIVLVNATSGSFVTGIDKMAEMIIKLNIDDIFADLKLKPEIGPAVTKRLAF